MDEANVYLQNQFLENDWNKENTVRPQDETPAYTPLNPYLDLSPILSVEETRKIASHRTISGQGKRDRVVDGTRIGYGSVEAIFRADPDGRRRIFVRDQEVRLEVIEEPVREPVEAEERLEIYP